MRAETGKARNRVQPVRLVVYSDYLCPWCYNASVRLRRLENELTPRFEVVWKSYLLRPEPRPRNPEKFRSYTASWKVPAAEADSGTFSPWPTGAPPPTHSVPAQRVAKAAAMLGPDAFHRMHDALLVGYFGQGRDISDEDVLRDIWREKGLDDAAFETWRSQAILDRVLANHEEARALGINGAPAARLEDNEAFLTGALPLGMYRRWIGKQLDRRSTSND